MKFQKETGWRVALSLLLIYLCVCQSLTIAQSVRLAAPAVTEANSGGAVTAPPQKRVHEVIPLTPEQLQTKHNLFVQLEPATIVKYEARCKRKGLDAWQLMEKPDGISFLRPKCHLETPDEIKQYAGRPLEDIVKMVPNRPGVIHYRSAAEGGYWNTSFTGTGLVVRPVKPNERVGGFRQSWGFDWFPVILPEYDERGPNPKRDPKNTSVVLGIYNEVTGERVGMVNCGNGDWWEPPPGNPKLEVEKLVDSPTDQQGFVAHVFVQHGVVVEFQTTINNPGDVSLTHLKADDELPPELELLPDKDNVQCTPGFNCLKTVTGNRIHIELEQEFVVGARFVVSYKARVVGRESKDVENLIEINTDQIKNLRRRAKVTIIRPANPAASIVKLVRNPAKSDKYFAKVYAEQNQVVDYLVDVVNDGTVAAHLLSLADERDLTEIEYVAGSAKLERIKNNVVVETIGLREDVAFSLNRVLISDLQFAVGETLRLTYSAKVLKSEGEIVNWAIMDVEKVGERKEKATVVVEPSGPPRRPPGEGEGRPVPCECPQDKRTTWAAMGEYDPDPKGGDKVRLGSLIFGAAEYAGINKKARKDKKNQEAADFWDFGPNEEIELLGKKYNLRQIVLLAMQKKFSEATAIANLTGGREVSDVTRYQIDLDDEVTGAWLWYNWCTGEVKLVWKGKKFPWKEVIITAILATAAGIGIGMAIKGCPIPVKQFFNPGTTRPLTKTFTSSGVLR